MAAGTRRARRWVQSTWAQRGCAARAIEQDFRRPRGAGSRDRRATVTSIRDEPGVGAVPAAGLPRQVGRVAVTWAVWRLDNCSIAEEEIGVLRIADGPAATC